MFLLEIQDDEVSWPFAHPLLDCHSYLLAGYESQRSLYALCDGEL